jgi:hypothetical protein
MTIIDLHPGHLPFLPQSPSSTVKPFAQLGHLKRIIKTHPHSNLSANKIDPSASCEAREGEKTAAIILLPYQERSLLLTL